MQTRSLRFLSILVALFALAGAVSRASAQTSPDKVGPLMLSARVLEEPLRTNRIQITWNENLQVSTLTTTNLKVFLAGSNVTVTISNASYNPGTYPLPGIPPTMTCTMSTTNLHYRSNYYIIANNIRDGRGNVIAPNSIITVTWPNLPPNPLPPSATPILSITRVGSNEVQISWPTNAYGYALDWATNITTAGPNSVAGPWCEEQPLMANPYVTIPSSDTHRIYRLRKTQ